MATHVSSKDVKGTVTHIVLDGEPIRVIEPQISANQLIQEYGKKDPSTNYLVRIHGHDRESFQNRGDEILGLQNGQHYQIISTGPTPVSDVGPVGTAAFTQGLRDMGFSPIVSPTRADHVIIEYTVPVGKYENKRVRLGFVIPPDFPLAPPAGPHISPRIHGERNGGSHPLGGVLNGNSAGFQEAFEGEWQYWSRPIQGWPESRKAVATYMGHIWRLWETQ